MLQPRCGRRNRSEFDSATISPAAACALSHVQVNLGVLVVQVDGAGCGAVVQSQDVKHSLEGPRRRAGRSADFCGDGDILGVLAEGFCIAVASGQVTGGGAGGVRVDVTTVSVDVAVFEGFAQCAVAPSAAGSGAVMW